MHFERIEGDGWHIQEVQKELNCNNQGEKKLRSWQEVQLNLCLTRNESAGVDECEGRGLTDGGCVFQEKGHCQKLHQGYEQNQ